MPPFVKGASYLYLWLIIMASTVMFVIPALMFRSPALPLIHLNACLGVIFFNQVRSGIALDRWWRGAFSRDDFRYQTSLIFQAVVLSAMSVVNVASLIGKF